MTTTTMLFLVLFALSIAIAWRQSRLSRNLKREVEMMDSRLRDFDRRLEKSMSNLQREIRSLAKPKPATSSCPN